MRPVHLHDLDTLTRTLLVLPEPDQPIVARQIVQAADIADKYRKRLGRAHPQYGLGTLTSAVQDLPKATTLRCDQAYRRCLGIVLAALG